MEPHDLQCLCDECEDGDLLAVLMSNSGDWQGILNLYAHRLSAGDLDGAPTDHWVELAKQQIKIINQENR